MKVKPGYKQTEVGVIPEDWQLRPMLSTVRVANGQVDPKAEPYRSMTLVAPDHIESGSGRLLKKETACDQRAISGKYLFAKGDIVYSKIRPYLRKAILADFDGLCSADMYPLKPATDISSGFILAAILGHHFSKYAESVSVRSGMPKINRAELAEYTIAIPPTKAEQEAISEALSNADALIESLEQLVVKKRQIKQGAMQGLLTGKKRLPGFEIKRGYRQTESGVIPEDWEVKSAREFAAIKTGPFGTLLKASEYSESDGVPLISVGEIREGFLRISAQTPCVTGAVTRRLPQYVLRKGDIVFGRKGGVERSALIRQPQEGWFLGSDGIGVRPSQECHAEYLALQFQSKRVQSWLLQNAIGTTMPSLNQEILRNVAIPLPPTRAEQEAIAAILSDMDTEIAALEAKLAKARQLKQGMMQELLTGRIRLV